MNNKRKMKKKIKKIKFTLSDVSIATTACFGGPLTW
jgi:hypothetical protein